MIYEKKEKKKVDERSKKYDGKILLKLAEAKRFFWEDKDYMIVPAGNCEELMEEGRKLHHCVGASEIYMSKMAAGESWILFLRKKEDLQTPYYTIEIDMYSDKILQWYSEYDRQPDREKIQKVLERFRSNISYRRTAEQNCLAAGA